MEFDLFLAGLILIFGLFGMLSGALRQLRHWVGLIFAAVAARPLAVRLAPGTAPLVGLPPPVVYVGLCGLLFCLLYLIGAGIAGGILTEIFAGHEDGGGDRAFGFVLGAAKGAALLFILLSFLVFFEKPLTKAFGVPPAPVRGSRAVALVRRRDLFDAVPVPGLAKAEKLLESTKDLRALKELENDPEVRRLLDAARAKAATR